MSINCIALGKRICFYRLKFNITQEKLAALTNCSREYIAYLESGTKTPSLPTLIDLANLSHLLYLLLLLDFFQVSAQCILPSRKRSKACLHQLALIQTTIERTSSFAQTILRRGHWQDFRLPSSLTVDFFVKSYQLM